MVYAQSRRLLRDYCSSNRNSSSDLMKGNEAHFIRSAGLVIDPKEMTVLAKD